jgi:UDP-N-acetylglucosamine--N-acetylmuramyl-(pentapeptide) pyrophosphoryl-undecaprenol N-acetylglucosamine transferase
LGRANRLLAPRVRRIATCFAEVARLRHADRARTSVTGNPVRPSVAALRGVPYEIPDQAGPFALFVMGGSQGARILSEVVPAAVAAMPEALRARLRIVQQARPEDIDRVRAAYRACGVSAEIKSFFDDVPAKLAGAHLVICRCGASTVAELTVVGRPAILVPYRYAADDHQTANARALDAAGAAWVMPESLFVPTALTERLAALMTAPAALAQIASRAYALGRPEAAERLADLVLETAGEGLTRGAAA